MSARIEQQAVTDGWRAEGKYGFVHPSGWSIGRYIVNCVETYMLWHGNETQGRFSTADEAKRKHIDLCALDFRDTGPGNRPLSSGDEA